MHKFIVFLLTLILLISPFLFSQKYQIGSDAAFLMRNMDDNLNYSQCYFKMQMINYKGSKEDRNFLMDIKYKKDKGTIIEFLSPKREKGKKMLSRGDTLWMFVPGVSKPVRLSLKENFMGTAMSNYDLMDYDYHNDFSATIQGYKKYKDKNVYVIELVGKKKSAYDKLIVYLEETLLVPLYMEFYTISGNKIKEMDFEEIKKIGNKDRPSVMIMRDLLDKTTTTKVILLELREEKFSDEIFLPQKLVE